MTGLFPPQLFYDRTEILPFREVFELLLSLSCIPSIGQEAKVFVEMVQGSRVTKSIY